MQIAAVFSLKATVTVSRRIFKAFPSRAQTHTAHQKSSPGLQVWFTGTLGNLGGVDMCLKAPLEPATRVAGENLRSRAAKGSAVARTLAGQNVIQYPAAQFLHPGSQVGNLTGGEASEI